MEAGRFARRSRATRRNGSTSEFSLSESRLLADRNLVYDPTSLLRSRPSERRGSVVHTSGNRRRIPQGVTSGAGAYPGTLVRRVRVANAYAGIHKDRKRTAMTPERQSSTMAARRKPTDPTSTASASRNAPTQTAPSRRTCGAIFPSQANSAGSRLCRLARPQTSRTESNSPCRSCRHYLGLANSTYRGRRWPRPHGDRKAPVAQAD